MAPFIRIALRYLAGVLIAFGIMDPGVAMGMADDAELIEGISTVIGLVVAALTELWYARVRKTGGAT